MLISNLKKYKIMVTEIPVFLQLNTEISLSDFEKKLQACNLSEITPYEAVYLDKDHQKDCFAFNVEGNNQDEILSKLQTISSLDLGRIDFASIKFCGHGIHCCFSILDMKITDLMAYIIGYISDTEFTAYLMKRNEQISYLISVLDPKYLNSLDYPAQFQEIMAWKKEAKYILEYLHAGSIDFMQVGYYPL